MNVDNSFNDNNYKLSILNEIKNGFEVYYFPNGNMHGGKDGIIVQVTTGINNWIGIFAFDEMVKKGFSGIYTMPDYESFCVVSNGAGYIVKFDNPTNWEEIKSIPIIDVKIVINKKIIIFADYTKLVAYNTNGFLWETKQLSFDGLKLNELNDFFITGEYYDLRSESIETFKVNLEDGSHKCSIEEI